MQSSFNTLSHQTALNEILYKKVYLSPRSPPNTVLKTAWQVGHETHQYADKQDSDTCEIRQQTDVEFNVKHGRPVAQAKPIHIFG